MELKKNFNQTIGHRLRDYREFMHLTREQFSEKCDISASFLSAVESGQKAITSKTIYKICTAFDISADFLIFGKNEDIETAAILDMVQALPPESRTYAIQILKTYIEGIHSIQQTHSSSQVSGKS